MGLGEGSWFPKAAVVCILLALLLHLIGMGAPNWAKTNPRLTDRDEHIGLWKYCTNPVGSSTSDCDDFINIISGDWIKAAQAFSILAMFALFGAVGLTIVYAFVPDMQGEMKILGATIAVQGISALFVLVTVGTFAGTFQEYFNTKERSAFYMEGSGVLDWAFGVAAAGCGLAFLAFGFMIAEVGRERQ